MYQAMFGDNRPAIFIIFWKTPEQRFNSMVLSFFGSLCAKLSVCPLETACHFLETKSIFGARLFFWVPTSAGAA